MIQTETTAAVDTTLPLLTQAEHRLAAAREVENAARRAWSQDPRNEARQTALTAAQSASRQAQAQVDQLVHARDRIQATWSQGLRAVREAQGAVHQVDATYALDIAHARRQLAEAIADHTQQRNTLVAIAGEDAVPREA